MRKRFNEPHDGQRVCWLPLFATGRQHLRPGDTFKYRVWNLRSNGAYQSGTKDVTGCLASNESDLHRRTLTQDSALGREQRIQEQFEFGLRLCQLGNFLCGFGLLLAASKRDAIGILDIA